MPPCPVIHEIELKLMMALHVLQHGLRCKEAVL